MTTNTENPVVVAENSIEPSDKGADAVVGSSSHAPFTNLAKTIFDGSVEPSSVFVRVNFIVALVIRGDRIAEGDNWIILVSGCSTRGRVVNFWLFSSSTGILSRALISRVAAAFGTGPETSIDIFVTAALAATSGGTVMSIGAAVVPSSEDSMLDLASSVVAAVGSEKSFVYILYRASIIASERTPL